MLALIWGSTFIKAYERTAKKHSHLRIDIEKTLKLLAQDPFSPPLETHKLKGKLSGEWAYRFGCDLRIIFEFV